MNVQKFIEKRDSDVGELMNIIRDLGQESCIFVYEGKADRYFYEENLNRTKIMNPEDVFFHCAKGRPRVLGAFKNLEKLTIPQGKKILFFVDKDFTNDNTAAGGSLYVLPRYAIENYIVDPETLERFLNGTGIDEKCKTFLLEEYMRMLKEFMEYYIQVNLFYLNERKNNNRFEFPFLVKILDNGRVVDLKHNCCQVNNCSCLEDFKNEHGLQLFHFCKGKPIERFYKEFLDYKRKKIKNSGTACTNIQPNKLQYDLQKMIKYTPKISCLEKFLVDNLS